MEMPDLSKGNCIGTDTESFFPVSTALSAENIAAKRICDRCEVREPCLEWALRHELHGIWGGVSAGERVKMRARLGISFTAPEVVVLQRVKNHE